MIPLRGIAKVVRGFERNPVLLRLRSPETPTSQACDATIVKSQSVRRLCESAIVTFEQYAISFEDNIAPMVVLPEELSYLDDGDVIRVDPSSRSVRVLYRRASNHNSVLLTERCDNWCLMCSQPPRQVDDRWIVDETLELMGLMNPETREVGLTGGEPSLLGDDLVRIVERAKSTLPHTAIHILSNGRGFGRGDLASVTFRK